MKLSQKVLVVLAVSSVLAILNVVKAECNLTVMKKKASARTAYLSGQKLNGKVLSALAANCNLNVQVLSKKEFLNFQMEALRLKIKEL